MKKEITPRSHLEGKNHANFTTPRRDKESLSQNHARNHSLSIVQGKKQIIAIR
jgi:hypothetical protein